MKERRLTERLKAYWEQLAAGEPLPDFKRLNPERFADLWPNCMTMAVVNAHSRKLLYSYQHVGDALKRVYGDLTGHYDSSAMRELPSWRLLKQIDAVIASPRVEEEHGQFVNEMHKIVKYRACLLPFGTGGTVTHVVIGMSYKEF